MFGFGFGLKSSGECWRGFFDDGGNGIRFSGDDGIEFASLSGEWVSIFVEPCRGACGALGEVVHGGPERGAGCGEHRPGKHSFIIHSDNSESNANADDAVDDVTADKLGHEGSDEHVLSGWMIEEKHDVVAVECEDGEEEDDGECHEYDSAESSFSGECFDLAKDFEAFADEFADFREDFGEVAACLSLDGDGGYEELKVHIRHAVKHISECLFDGQTEVLFFEDGFEFDGNGGWHFCSHDIESGGEAVS